jgi:hypothetical protein
MLAAPSVAGTFPIGGGTVGTATITATAASFYNAASNWTVGNAVALSATFAADL